MSDRSPQKTRKSSSKTRSSKPTRSHRTTLSLQKTEIIIHVYDLLPAGRFASTLWFLGTSLLHSGVVINGKEYAYGGHDQKGVTGVYWTKPKEEPPGGVFKCEILHGLTFAPEEEINTIVCQASEEFLGTSYNLLTKNCNHFTSFLCQKLTGRPAPNWLNRAASIGVALPCMVPRHWVEPPEYDTAGGELLSEDGDTDERSRMLRDSGEQHLVEQESSSRRASDLETISEEARSTRPPRKSMERSQVRDTSGRMLPAAERAPVTE